MARAWREAGDRLCRPAGARSAHRAAPAALPAARAAATLLALLGLLLEVLDQLEFLLAEQPLRVGETGLAGLAALRRRARLVPRWPVPAPPPIAPRCPPPVAAAPAGSVALTTSVNCTSVGDVDASSDIR